jgi:heme/copper-type cytochrome/quinol oxidase subunit 4
MDYWAGKEINMKLTARLILMVTIVVTATDVIEYMHIKQHPENLTISFLISVIVVTVVPIGIIIWYWHKRKWL